MKNAPEKNMFSRTILDSPEIGHTGPVADLTLETVDLAGPSLVSLLARRHGCQDFSGILKFDCLNI